MFGVNIRRKQLLRSKVLVEKEFLTVKSTKSSLFLLREINFSIENGII